MTEPELFQRMRVLDDTEKTSWAQKGIICVEVERTMAHRARIDPETGEPCTFTRWVRLACPWGYASAFAALRDVKELSDVPRKDLVQIPASNVGILRQLSTAVRAEPAVIQAAKTQRTAEFVAQVKRDHPQQHLEARRTLRFTVSESEATEIEEALALAVERGGAMNQTEALMAVCLNYRADMLLEELAKGEK